MNSISTFFIFKVYLLVVTSTVICRIVATVRTLYIVVLRSPHQLLVGELVVGFFRLNDRWLVGFFRNIRAIIRFLCLLRFFWFWIHFFWFVLRSRRAATSSALRSVGDYWVEFYEFYSGGRSWTTTSDGNIITWGCNDWDCSSNYSERCFVTLVIHFE